MVTQPAAETIFTELYIGDCLEWLKNQEANSLHAVITDPPYGMVEYSHSNLSKLRNGRGGVWRIPPSIGGSKRQPLPRFTVLTDRDTAELFKFFVRWGEALKPTLVPGAHVLIASSPLLSYLVSRAMVRARFDKRGEIVRMVRTLRGGDRPKGAEEEFPEISAMPRSCWEPWLIFRKPLEGTLAENLRKYKTGGLRRPKSEAPFTDVILSSRTPRQEKKIAPHPNLKPQHFLRTLVKAVLPLDQGIVLDPFAGAGSTLAACQALGYDSIGVESDTEYAKMASAAIPKLAALEVQLDSIVSSDGDQTEHSQDLGTQDSTEAFQYRIGESRPLSYVVNLHVVR